MEVDWSEFASDDIALLREDYIGNELEELNDDIDKAEEWCRVFPDVPLLSLQESKDCTIDGIYCAVCRVSKDPRTPGMLGLIFDKAVTEGTHPYDQTTEELKDQVSVLWYDESQTLQDRINQLMKEKEHWFVRLQGLPPLV